MADLQTLLSYFLQDLYAGTWGATIAPTTITLASAGVLQWSTDLKLSRDAANVLALKNADTAQEFRVYGATTGTKYLSLKHDGTNARITPSSGGLTVVGGTQTTSQPFAFTQTWNNAAVAFAGVKWTFTDTASDAASLAMQILGGAAGTTNLLSVDKSGNVSSGGAFQSYNDVRAAAASLLYWNTRSRMASQADGTIEFKTSAMTGFNTLNLGPATGNTANGTWQISKVSVTCTIASDTNCSGKGTGTITVTGASNLIPAGSVVFGVTARVTTIIAGSDGIATWALGYAGDTDAWGAALNLAATTTVDGTAFTATGPVNFPAATAVTFSGTGGKIIDSGVIKITIYYFSFIPISA